MSFKNIMIILGALIIIAVLASYAIFWPRKIKEVQGISTPLPLPSMSSSPSDEGITAQGKFYAPILFYHHIANHWPQSSYYVSPKIFDKQMSWLQDNGYQVISFDQFYEAALNKTKIPSKPVVITFDDGLADQYTNAFPILKKYNVTATFFIKINNYNKGGMTTSQLRELQLAGNIIGSHSFNHDNMAYMSANQLKYELEESKRILETDLGTQIKYFCYPGGEYSKTTIQAAKAAGYLAAVTTQHKVYQEIKNDNSFYTIPRVHIDDEMPTFIDWVQGKNLI